ncbi:transcription antitermination factor NusB [Candidatus Shapirobacteria bacterium]|nr:transcription antitermination factor NusB [Candidatus Shapirobacteria bacterium]
MKKGSDPRHKERQAVLKELFAQSFSPQNPKALKEKTKKILKLIPEIDKIIEKAAPEFLIEGINKIDLAILRLAVFELLWEKKEPPAVVIDEAVELAKEFGSQNSPKFVNGALGAILKTQNSHV